MKPSSLVGVASRHAVTTTHLLRPPCRSPPPASGTYRTYRMCRGCICSSFVKRSKGFPLIAQKAGAEIHALHICRSVPQFPRI